MSVMCTYEVRIIISLYSMSKSVVLFFISTTHQLRFVCSRRCCCCVALRCVVASSQKTPNTGQNRIVRVSVRANGITRKQTHNILLLNYTILGHTRWFAASAYCVQYLSIACDAASGHTCYYYFYYLLLIIIIDYMFRGRVLLFCLCACVCLSPLLCVSFSVCLSF